MSPIEVVCPRCSSVYHVAEAKAGKHGRCPKCGGLMHVPQASPHHPAHPVNYSVPMTRREKRLLIWIPVSLLIIAVGAYMAHRHMAARAVARERQIETSPTAEAMRHAQFELHRLNGLQTRLEEYIVLAAEEKRLLARKIRQRYNAREPVTPYEYQIRNEVVEARAQFERTKPDAAAKDDWKLDENLSPDEAERLVKLTAATGGEARTLADLLTHAGVEATVQTDPLGRTLLESAPAAEKLEQERRAALQRLEEAREAYRRIGGKP